LEPGAAFGKVLRERRKAAGLSQERLALDAGLERVFISMLERGHRQPSLHTILKLAGILGCPANELVLETEKLLADANQCPKDRHPREDMGIRYGGHGKN
jgi:transcriptional regulator with XRE-family HTH domain